MIIVTIITTITTTASTIPVKTRTRATTATKQTRSEILKNNNSTNENAVNNEKLEAQLQEIRIEKHNLFKS